ncbi:HAMP domain-containing sensor histidine kinase [Geobacter sp.]|uniref:sensor histidine kinase n=1 Tax=Geobacter sp. TaxID=46610 RepID=UPI002633765C|nr:HAMP domain-containing sensor histidine kinase [Geobacter sp.]
MKWLKRLANPLMALIGIQLVWGLVVFFWIYWFMGRHREFRELAMRYHPELLSRGFDWIVLVEGLLLLVIIMAGVYVMFLYWRRQSNLYREQKDFISQATHELKSPLASIKLHLETIRLRKPPPEKLERFLDTMLEDVERLDDLTSNFLMAAKLEQRRRASQYPVVDLSGLVAGYLERKRGKLPEGGSVTLDIEEGIKVAIDAEGFKTVLRNLFENAILYSPATPEIRVALRREGNRCVLTFQDSGMGIAADDLKKIFRKFFRVRRPGETIRGTGLGLWIVRTVVREHGGSISVASPGIGRGTVFTITLPLARQEKRP